MSWKYGNDFVGFEDEDIEWDFVMGQEDFFPSNAADVPDDMKVHVRESAKRRNFVYVCPTCDKQYKSLSGFKGHMKNVHDTNVKVPEH
ncbi:uncharacterized protein LOC102807001 [Saccoglossus kowalevskii]